MEGDEQNDEGSGISDFQSSKSEKVAKRKSYFVFVIVLVLIAASFWFYNHRLGNPLLGKWIYQSGYLGLDPTDTDAIGERGMEFVSGSRFVCFGYKVDGRPVNHYGVYSFVSSNRVKLDSTGFRTVFDGTNADVKLEGKFPAQLMSSRFFLYNSAEQELVEEGAITTPARFKKESSNNR